MASFVVNSCQCDQMAILFALYLAFYNIENLFNSIQIVPKYVQNFAKYFTNRSKIAKEL